MGRGLWACGTIGRTHGLKGEVYLDLVPNGIAYLEAADEFQLSVEGGDRLTPARVSRIGGTDRRPLLRLEGVDSRECAAALYGSTLFACGERLDSGEFFRVGDLLGLRAHCDGHVIGVVEDVIIAPAHEIVQIRGADGAVHLVPFVAELVDVDLEAGVLGIREGLL